MLFKTGQRYYRVVFVSVVCLLGHTVSYAAQAAPNAAGARRGGGAAASNPDHAQMLTQLGITTPLREGARGSDVNAPNYANYDESKATAKSKVPELLVMNDGRKITTPALWEERRKELLEIFDREFYGRVPAAANSIKVNWEVTSTTPGMSGGVPTITRQLVGHVDPTYYPAITINIGASVTTPANATGKVPVIIVWGGGGGGGARAGGARGAAAAPALGATPVVLTIDSLKAVIPDLTAEQITKITPLLTEIASATPGLDSLRADALTKLTAILSDTQKPLLAALTGGGARAGGARAGGARGAPGGGGGGGSWQQQALARGWGYGSLNPGSIQADSGGNNLRLGIIGLINKGEPRKPDDWGALRAWAWGASRLIDFFATDDKVDATQVAFQGHSRYGKATLVTLVYEPRAFTGFVSSSGEGGAKLWRHLVGEQVENLAGPSEYHWMAGNFLKYAGPLTVDVLPADAHQFIALIAPRPVFISGGEYVEFNGAPGHPESRYSGESWQDTPGTFMATAAASPAWELLGKKGLTNTALNLHYSTSGAGIQTVKIPAPLTSLIDGELAFRQHDQGHTDAPNWNTFIEFVGHYFRTTDGKSP
jgi:hypothetical protein